jgi:hypothetical protein
VSTTSLLFRAARLSASGRAIRRTAETGNLKYVARRGKNVLLGRTMARAGVWRAIWR